MRVCVPVTVDGRVGHGWGRAARVAVADVDGGHIAAWEEHDVRWDELHDVGSEGGHHARIARFVSGHGIERVVAGHMGPPMVQMLGRMGVEIRVGVEGDAHEVVASQG